MSATNRGAERHEYDLYETPSGVCDAALATVFADADSRILDVGAGSGAWGRAARRRWPKAFIEGVDLVSPETIDKVVYNVWSEGDFLTLPDVDEQFDLVVGNPPFNLAEEFVHRGLACLKPNGQMHLLLRLNFLEGVNRRATMWSTTPLSDVRVFSKRISFTQDGRTDAAAYAFFSWRKGHQGPFAGGWL